MRPMAINQGLIHHRSYACCFPHESTAGRGGDRHGNSQYSWSQKQISKRTCKSKRRICFGYSKKTSQDNLRGVPGPTSAGVMWGLGRRRWHHSRLLSGSCSTASTGHRSSTRTLPTSSVKGQVHTLLLDWRLRSYPSSAPLLMRISTSTGLPEPHPDEHEPFNETGSPLSAGGLLGAPPPTFLLPPGPPSQDTGVTGEPARCVFCIVQSTPKTPLTVPPICCYLTDLSRDHFLWGEKRHIYISGKMDPCTLPVRSQNRQKAGRNQDRNHHLHLSGATTVSVETGVCGFRKVNWKPSESMRGWAKPQAYFSCKARTLTGIPKEPV